VSWDRVVQSKDRLAATPLPGWVVSALTDRTLHVYAAKLIVLTELFIAVGLWWRGTRYAAVWVAVCFHLSIEASANVEVFSYLGIAALAIWAVPSTRDRVLGMDLSAAGQRWLATAVGRLDWLARFRVEETHNGPVRVVDRDGRVFHGGPAVALVLSRLPLTAWFALPFLPVLRAWQRGSGSASRYRTTPAHGDDGPPR
jgi:hypothetical protein